MIRQSRQALSFALLICLSLLTACQQPSPSTIATTQQSPTAEPTAALVATAVASPAPGEMKTSPSGLQYQDLRVGSGPRPLMMQNVRVAYVGKFPDGHKFDSNTTDFTLGKGEVIKGWDWGIGGNAKEGIEPMRVGGKRKLIIPPQLGYGDKPYGTIPANSTLVFEIELIKINGGGF